MNGTGWVPKTDVGQRFEVLTRPLEPLLRSTPDNSDPGSLALVARKVFRFFLDQKDGITNHADIADVDDVLLRLWPSWAAPRTGLAQVVLDLLALSEGQLLRSDTEDVTRQLKRFHGSWKEQVLGAENSEYSICVQCCGLLLQGVPRREFQEVRQELLEVIGETLNRLGWPALDELRRKLTRTGETPPRIDPESLVNLSVLWKGGQSPHTLRLGEGSLEFLLIEAVRCWAAGDPFLDSMFHVWGWIPTIDWTSPVTPDEVQGMDAFSQELFRSWRTASRKLGVGRGRAKTGAGGATAAGAASATREEDGSQTRFEEIPIALFGRSGIGKTSFLCAVAHRALKESGPDWRLQPGREFLSHYEVNKAMWMAGAPAMTAAAHHLDFTVSLHGSSLRFETFDYRGEDSLPSSLTQDLQARLAQSKGFLFFLDDDLLKGLRAACSEAELLESDRALRERFGFYAEVLRWHRGKNGGDLGHLPVGLVVNKADLVFGPSLERLAGRTHLLSEKTAPGLHLAFRSSRFKDLPPHPPRSAAGALQACVDWDPANARSLILQRLLRRLSDCGSAFYDILVAQTISLQVFLASSRITDHAADDDGPWPYGALEPVLWAAETIIRQHLLENAEESALRADLAKKSRQLLAYYIHYLELKGPRFAAIDRERRRLERPSSGRFRVFGRFVGNDRRREDLDKEIHEIQADAQRFLRDAQDRGWIGDDANVEGALQNLRTVLPQLKASLKTLQKDNETASQDAEADARRITVLPRV